MRLSNTEIYSGFRTIQIGEGHEENTNIYEKLEENFLELNVNEYVVILDETEKVRDLRKWNGSELTTISYPVINSRYMGKIRPRNIQQKLAMDMLYNPEITVKAISGRAGSGKTMLLCAAAIDLLEKNKFEKIIWVRNNIEVKNSKPIGYLPGSPNDKILPFAMPLVEKVGGVEGLEMMMDAGKIELAHLGFMRGRDIRNAIVICSEAENLTIDHAQMLLSRIGEGSEIWFDGDVAQVDAKVFEDSNGFVRLINCLKGQELFATVQLIKTERSKTAALSDLLM